MLLGPHKSWCLALAEKSGLQWVLEPPTLTRFCLSAAYGETDEMNGAVIHQQQHLWVSRDSLGLKKKRLGTPLKSLLE